MGGTLASSQMKKKILLVGQSVASRKALDLLRLNFRVDLHSSVSYLSQIPNLYEYFAVWIHFDTKLSHSCLSKISDSTLIISSTTGLTHIEESARIELGDRLISLRDEAALLEKITSTAELSWGLLLSAITRVDSGSKSVLSGEWDRQTNLRPLQVSSMVIGIVGYGRLGRIAAKVGRVLAREILVFDIDQDKNQEARSHGFSVCESLSELVSESDSIMIHASVTSRQPIITHRLLSEANFLYALINTSRGVLVDELAVVSALRQNSLGYYCADVLQFEDQNAPLNESLIWKELESGGKIILTPHIGGASYDAIEKVDFHLSQKIIAISSARS